jgi:protein-S-isoprenylcysteine O-methyltransferase Ste14
MTGALIAATLLGWMVLDGLAQRRAAAGRPPVQTESDDGSAAFAKATGLGSLLAGVLFAWWLPSLALPGARWAWLTFGLAIAWAGIALRVTAVTTLGSMFNTLISIHEDHVLVQHGPYRFVRHPSYAGVLLMSVGIGLALGNVASLVAIVGLRLAGYVRRINVEESALAEGLGDAYARYAQGRARLVPGVW